MTALNSMCVEFNINDKNYTQLSIDALAIHSTNKNKIYWIHCDPNQPEMLSKLIEKLHLPDSFIKLCNEEETIPKLIETGDSLTLRFQSLLSNEIEDIDNISFNNLIIHMTEQYCLTVSPAPLPALVAFTKMYSNALKYAETPCFILFLILDNVINDYAKILFELDLIAEEVDLNFNLSQRNIYNEVVNKKNYVMQTKRHVAAIRDILMRISGRKIAVISETCRQSLGNLFNHCQMVVTEADGVRDILNGTLDKIDNSLMQKMNETMKVLTAFAAIFLPITLISSIYGMNFQWIPELGWKYGYFWALFLMFACGITLLFIFKKMKWF